MDAVILKPITVYSCDQSLGGTFFVRIVRSAVNSATFGILDSLPAMAEVCYFALTGLGSRHTFPDLIQCCESQQTKLS